MKKFLSIIFSFALCLATCCSFLGCNTENEEQTKPQEHVHTYSSYGWTAYKHYATTNCKEHDVLYFEENHEYDINSSIIEIEPQCKKPGRIRYCCKICRYDEHYEYPYKQHNFIQNSNRYNYLSPDKSVKFSCSFCDSWYSINFDYSSIIGYTTSDYTVNNLILPTTIYDQHGMPLTFTTVKKNTFAHLENTITSVTFSETIQTIEYSAFNGCYGLEYVILNQNIKNVSSYSFNNCSRFNKIYYLGTKNEWESKQNIYFALPIEIYFLTETQPTETGNYWHYVAGEPTVWQ